MSRVYGRDGRELVTAREACTAFGFQHPESFMTWARRRGIRAKASRTTRGRPQSLYDLADITAAVIPKPRSAVDALAARLSRLQQGLAA